ncbi:GntR family transcriptional regulator [Ramlibacter sp. XY19]|uniref:GntR family transcriptional regulator n=1 Tax=Ramlibacter paludis TaxID=2908000 RepID=UPI0023DBE54D|nr:GntR family transcriptional regulator [Ramlibacter paludis]MCG2594417.1 GntR family transcriptional regulator [Ramlibacter paludis]
MRVSPPASELTPLQQRVAREIVSLVRRESRKAGDHLREVELAERIGTSRSPVQVALRHLAAHGVVQQDVNRGYFMVRDAKDWGPVSADLDSTPDDPLYLAIVEARRTGALPQEVSEAELMRRFGVVRGTLRKVLARISEEGWVEQNVGQGWTFMAMIDTPDAYEESYLFRQAIEPTGMMSPSFRIDPPGLAELRREQQRIVDGGYRTMTAIELFEANSRFHETLAHWSGNRFIEQAVRRVNQQRRLVEYHQASQRKPRQTQAQEHLQILDALAAHDVLQAASLMRAHLEGARRAKVHPKS